MPINGMNIGKDYSFGYYDANVGLVDLGDVQNVKIRANYHDISSRPYNGPPRFGYVPDGFSIDFTITRTSSELEDFQILMSRAFDDGLVIKPGVLNETVHNPDDSVSRYQYEGFVFKVTDLGDISRDATVKISASGMASSKRKIA